MNNANAEGCWEVFCGLVLTIAGFSIGVSLSQIIVRESWREDAVKRGFAEYASDTGKWKWKESK